MRRPRDPDDLVYGGPHIAGAPGATRVKPWGVPERGEPPPLRRRGKESRERCVAAVLLVAASPLLAACAVAVKIEALVDPRARGPVLFREERISRGRRIPLLKFRTLTAAAMASLPTGPTHVKQLERSGHVTRVGRLLGKWYLDELPQLLNIVRGEMFFIGTRPYPVDAAEAEFVKGIDRKFEMPAGLVGPVQSYKGRPSPSELELDEEYWEAFREWGALRLLVFDLQIARRSLSVMLAHEGR